MSRDRCYPYRAEPRPGPLDQQSAADYDVLFRWCGSTFVLMTNPCGSRVFVDDPSVVEPPEGDIDSVFTRMSLHSLARAEKLDAAGATLDDELCAETHDGDSTIALVPGVDPDELRSAIVAAAEAAAIPSIVPKNELRLVDAIALTWVFVEDLQDRITTYLRPLTFYEWRDFAALCGYVLARTPTAPEPDTHRGPQPPPHTDAAGSSRTPGTPC